MNIIDSIRAMHINGMTLIQAFCLLAALLCLKLAFDIIRFQMASRRKLRPRAIGGILPSGRVIRF